MCLQNLSGFIMGWSSLTCHEGDRATPSQHRFHWLLNPGFVCAYWAIQLWFLVLRQHMTQGTFSEHEWLYVSLMHWPDETEQGPTWLEPEGWSLRFPEHSLQQIRGELHTLQSPCQFCLWKVFPENHQRVQVCRAGASPFSCMALQ